MRKILLIVLTFISLHAQSQDLKLIIPRGHTNPVDQIAYSADRKFVFSSDGSNELVVWDYESAKEVTRIPVSSTITSLVATFSHVYIGLRNGIVEQLDLNDFSIAVFYTSTAEISCLVIDDTQLILATADGHLATLGTDGELIDSLTLASGISSLNATNFEYIIGTADGKLIILQKDSNQELKQLTLGTSAINFVEFSPDGKQIAAGDERGKLHLINFEDYTLNNSYELFSLRARSLIFESDTTALAVGRDAVANYKRINLNTGIITIPELWKNESEFASFPLGLYKILRNQDKELFLSGYQQNIIRIDSVGNMVNFIGESGIINKISINESGTKLAIAFTHNEVQVIDLTGSRNPKSYTLSHTPTSLQWHGKQLFAGLNTGQFIAIAKDTVELKGNNIATNYPTTPLRINEEQTLLTRKIERDGLPLTNYKNLSLVKQIKKAGFQYDFHPDSGDLFLITTKKQLERWSTTGKIKRQTRYAVTNVVEFQFANSGNEVVVLTTNGLYKIDVNSSAIIANFPIQGIGGDHLFVAPKGDQLFLTKAYREKGSSTTNYFVQAIAGSTGEELFQLKGHTAIIKDIAFLKDGKYILTASVDGTIKLWDNKGNGLGDLVPLKGGEHTVVASNGQFDATTMAMSKLSYLQGTEVINLEQVKSKYYEPGLFAKLLGINNEKVRNVEPLSHVKLYPEFELIHPIYNDGKLGIKITSREGGTGRIVILINGKEVSSNVRATTTGSAEFDIINHPYLLTGDLNKISVKIYNESGDAVSRPRNIYYLDKQKPEDVRPHLYGLVVGVSDYRGDKMDLKYAAKDATDMAKAIEISAKDYLGEDYVHISSMTSLKDSTTKSWPSKENILEALSDIASKAKARDILFLYMSGHGEVDQDDQGEFFYLTADAGLGKTHDDIFRKEALISNFELMEKLQQISALKQVFIIDACHSGSLVTSLGNPSPTMSAAEVRSLENLKDRANIYVLAGSAADAVSYESTIYGQGLLTYSLLMGMKGPALRNNQFVDIMQLFNYATVEVPELANEIGGIQKPEVKIPSTGSFDIGELNDENKKLIKLNSPKPLFIYSSFQHEDKFIDILNLGRIVDSELRAMHSKKDAEIVFLNTNSYFDAYSIKGRYSIDSEHNILIKVKLFKDRGQIGDFDVTAKNTDEAKKLIMAKVLERIQPIINSN